MTNPTKPSKERVIKGKCPVCKIKVLTYKRDGLYFCHRCDRRFNLDTGEWQENHFWIKFDEKTKSDLKTKPKERVIRQVIKQQVKDGISPMSIIFSVGRLVTPDEADYLLEYEKKYVK